MNSKLWHMFPRFSSGNASFVQVSAADEHGSTSTCAVEAVCVRSAASSFQLFARHTNTAPRVEKKVWRRSKPCNMFAHRSGAPFQRVPSHSLYLEIPGEGPRSPGSRRGEQRLQEESNSTRGREQKPQPEDPTPHRYSGRRRNYRTAAWTTQSS